VPVPTETEASDGDDEPKLYLTARYRVMLTAAEYKAVDAYIRYKQANKKVWHAILGNCNQFAADVAEFIGLEAPSTWTSSTRVFIERLTERNGGRVLKSANLPDGAVRDAPDFPKYKSANSSRLR
jgi:hypothetical protein